MTKGSDRPWDVPGGRLLRNETVTEALARIVLAETGLALDRLTKLERPK